MPHVVTFEQAKAKRFSDHHNNLRTPFFESSADRPDRPYAFLMEYRPGWVTGPHYHLADQWQIVVGGDGEHGRHSVTPYFLHFSKAHTPYGPVVSGENSHLTFFVLFTHYQPGAQRLPAAREQLKQIPNRKPWQVTRRVAVPSGEAAGGAFVERIPDIEDERGLAAYCVKLQPGAKTTTPDPSLCEGQYVILLKGSLVRDSKEYRGLGLAYVEPDSGSFPLVAGDKGLDALVVNFPRSEAQAIKHHRGDSRTELKKWRCEMCDFTYDEALGLPGDGIRAGTRWADIPETWTCPDCSAAKSDFQPAE